MQVIIYPNEQGGVSILTPAPEFINNLEVVALKDVPPTKPWRIVDDKALPPRHSRDRWLWTESGPLSVAPETAD